MKCQENLIRVQRLQQWLQDGKRIAQEVCKLEADVARKWWCQIELKFEVCEFCLRKMLQMTEVKNPDGKMKEMKVWKFYVVVC